MLAEACSKLQEKQLTYMPAEARHGVARQRGRAHVSTGDGPPFPELRAAVQHNARRTHRNSISTQRLAWHTPDAGGCVHPPPETQSGKCPCPRPTA